MDVLRIGNWQRAGGKGEAPKPIPRPGDVVKSAELGRRLLEQRKRLGT